VRKRRESLDAQIVDMIACVEQWIGMLTGKPRRDSSSRSFVFGGALNEVLCTSRTTTRPTNAAYRTKPFTRLRNLQHALTCHGGTITLCPFSETAPCRSSAAFVRSDPR
jgi:hypothetical protein